MMDTLDIPNEIGLNFLYHSQGDRIKVNDWLHDNNQDRPACIVQCFDGPHYHVAHNVPGLTRLPAPICNQLLDASPLDFVSKILALSYPIAHLTLISKLRFEKVRGGCY